MKRVREKNMYQRSSVRILVTMLAYAIVVTLPTAQFLHAIIPHQHGPIAGEVGMNAAPSHVITFYSQLSYKYFDLESGRFVSAADALRDAAFSDSKGNVSEVWSFIHFSLAHEEKKTVPDDITFALIAVFIACAVRAIVVLLATERTRPLQYDSLLSRGILPSRKFG